MASESISNNFSTNIHLATHTSMQVGGKAKFFFEPSNLDEIIKSFEWAKNNTNKKPFILGAGSNLIISDNGYDGLVIKLGKKFSGIEWKTKSAIIKAGTKLNDVVKNTAIRGMAGIEKLAGIPGSIGGAVYMNAGAYGQTISESIVSVTTLSNGIIKKYDKKDMIFDYRKSQFTGTDQIILQVELQFKTSDKKTLQTIINNTIQKRKNNQPLKFHNSGSIFKRPPNNYAGTLIEKAGLKGKKIGGAQISNLHAGFIINEGNATSSDIFKLIKFTQKEVKNKFGIELETEVVLLGDFN